MGVLRFSVPARWRYCILGRPSSFEAGSDQFAIKSEFFAGLCDGQGLASNGDHSSITPIIDLLLSRGPSHIARLVIAIFVGKSVDRMLRGWPRTDVGKKVFETVFPASADTYSSTTVIVEIFHRRIQASPLNIDPTSIFWRRHSHRMAMPNVRFVPWSKLAHRTTLLGRSPIFAPAICTR